MLSTKIHESFWADEDVGRLQPGEKLAVVWMLTKMNNIGYLKVSRREFQFDTGLGVEALEGACKGLARGFRFETSEGGLKVLSLNYIRYQFGDVACEPKNNVFKNLVRLAGELNGVLQEALFERYEGLRRGFEGWKGLTRGLQGAYKGLEGTRAEQSRAEQSTEDQRSQGGPAKAGVPGEGVEVATERAEGEDGGRRDAGAPRLRMDLAGEVLGFLNAEAGTAFVGTQGVLFEIASRLAEVGQDVAGMKGMVRRQVALWGKDGKMREYLRPATLFREEKFPDYWGKRHLAAVPAGAGSAQERQARRRELEEAIAQHPANRDSVCHRPDCGEETKGELRRLRGELAELRK